MQCNVIIATYTGILVKLTILKFLHNIINSTISTYK